MSGSVCRSMVWFGRSIVGVCFIVLCFIFIEVVLLF